MYKKFTYILVIVVFCSAAFGGYLHEQDIDDSAYVIALGFDKADNDKISLTFQVSIPSEKSSSDSEGSSSSSSKNNTIIKTVECNSFALGLDLANKEISKQLNLCHCKYIVFSEGFAKEGIENYIYTLVNNLELRSNCNIVVSTSSAEEFLNSASPILEHSVSKYYATLASSNEYTGYTSNATLNTVYTTISDTFGETTTILGSLQESSNSSEDNSSSSSQEQGSSSDSSQNSEESKKEIIIGGIAAFKDDRLVGTLSTAETIPYLIVTNKLKQCIISIPSPFTEGEYIDFHISNFAKAKHKVSLEPDAPHISTAIDLQATILSNNVNFDSCCMDDLKKLEDSLSDYIKKSILEYYEKTSKEFKSDITGLGKYAVYNFPTVNDWNEYNWCENYQKANFDVTVNSTIESSYFIS